MNIFTCEPDKLISMRVIEKKSLNFSLVSLSLFLFFFFSSKKILIFLQKKIRWTQEVFKMQS